MTLNIIKNNNLFDLVPEEEISRAISDFNKDDKSEKLKKCSIYKKAKETNLLREYIQFRYLSENVHNGFRPLYENLIFKKDGVILDSGFQIENIKEILFLIIGFFRDSLNVIISYIDADSLKKEFILIEDKLKKIIGN